MLLRFEGREYNCVTDTRLVCLTQEEVTDLMHKCDDLNAELLTKATELSEAVKVRSASG